MKRLHLEGFDDKATLLPLPYEASAFSLVVAERCLEYLAEPEGFAFLSECQRILTPGGRLRISTPDLSVLVRSYVERRVDRYADLGSPASSPATLLNGLMRANGRIFLYDEAELTTDLVEAGFENVCRIELSDEREMVLQANKPHGG